MPRTHLVTSTDVALLRSLAHEPSLVAASRRVGISRDRAVYRIARLARAFGGPVVRSSRGGARHGGTELTVLGDRILRRGFDSVELEEARQLPRLSSSTLLRGVYHRSPHPEVVVGGTLHLRVAFAGGEGETVFLTLDPEAVLVARRRFASSARNVLAGTIETIRPAGRLGRTLVVRAGAVRLRVSVTTEPVRLLGLRPGAKVILYVKATALRRVGRPRLIRGSPRS
jgi:molybdate transport system regulatory protein